MHQRTEFQAEVGTSGRPAAPARHMQHNPPSKTKTLRQRTEFQAEVDVPAPLAARCCCSRSAAASASESFCGWAVHQGWGRAPSLHKDVSAFHSCCWLLRALLGTRAAAAAAPHLRRVGWVDRRAARLGGAGRPVGVAQVGLGGGRVGCHGIGQAEVPSRVLETAASQGAPRCSVLACAAAAPPAPAGRQLAHVAAAPLGLRRRLARWPRWSGRAARAGRCGAARGGPAAPASRARPPTPVPALAAGSDQRLSAPHLGSRLLRELVCSRSSGLSGLVGGHAGAWQVAERSLDGIKACPYCACHFAASR